MMRAPPMRCVRNVVATVAHPSGQEAFIQLTDGSVHKVTISSQEGHLDIRPHFKSKLPKSCLKMEAVSSTDIEESPGQQALFLCNHRSLLFYRKPFPFFHNATTKLLIFFFPWRVLHCRSLEQLP